MFRHNRVILRQLVINALPSYTSISNDQQNTQLSHKLSHSHTFRHYRIILRQLVINVLPSYTRISNDQQNTQLSHKLSYPHMFRYYRIILRELVINALPSYTRISNDQQNTQLSHKLPYPHMFRHYRIILRELVINTLKHLNCKLYYQQLYLKYWCNLARYWLQAVWGWHNSVETCNGVIICEIIVHLLVIVQNKKNPSRPFETKKNWSILLHPYIAPRYPKEHSFEGSQVSAACPSEKSNIKIKIVIEDC
jgi:predicted secreted protein